MILVVNTRRPRTLLRRIKEEIDNRNIDTWEYDNEGDFTHIPKQWYKHAWIRPIKIESKISISFRLIKRHDYILTNEERGVYVGRFTEMLIAHFIDIIESVDVEP